MKAKFKKKKIQKMNEQESNILIQRIGMDRYAFIDMNGKILISKVDGKRSSHQYQIQSNI